MIKKTFLFASVMPGCAGGTNWVEVVYLQWKFNLLRYVNSPTSGKTYLLYSTTTAKKTPVERSKKLPVGGLMFFNSQPNHNRPVLRYMCKRSHRVKVSLEGLKTQAPNSDFVCAIRGVQRCWIKVQFIWQKMNFNVFPTQIFSRLSCYDEFNPWVHKSLCSTFPQKLVDIPTLRE